MTVGAQPSDRVAWLLGRLRILPPPPVRQQKESAIPKIIRREMKAKEASKPQETKAPAKPAAKAAAKSK